MGTPARCLENPSEEAEAMTSRVGVRQHLLPGGLFCRPGAFLRRLGASNRRSISRSCRLPRPDSCQALCGPRCGRGASIPQVLPSGSAGSGLTGGRSPDRTLGRRCVLAVSLILLDMLPCIPQGLRGAADVAPGPRPLEDATLRKSESRAYARESRSYVHPTWPHDL